jgi:hypothetical protein
MKFRENTNHGMEFKKLAGNSLMMQPFGCFSWEHVTTQTAGHITVVKDCVMVKRNEFASALCMIDASRWLVV